MILTEEQREAIKYAISSLEQCGSEPEDPVVAKILGAMIDSSDHIVEHDELIGFDLEKARASIAHYRIENPSNVDTESALKELVDQANLAEDALAEIERLQGFETAARDLNNDLIRIAGERDELAARIQELEDAHKRSGVKYAKIINELRSSVYANIPGLKKQWDEILNAPANGKIGPDADAKPRVWQITDERKAAIKELSELLTAIGCPSCHYYIQKNYGEDITVLRAMLTEAE